MTPADLLPKLSEAQRQTYQEAGCSVCLEHDIMRQLSKAQRSYLTDRAEWRSPAMGHDQRWMTFPPAATHRVLIGWGLVDRSGQLRDRGLAVRALLMEQENV